MDPTTNLTHRTIFTRGGTQRYVGRFAPSPSGPLHAGSLATALASWLDARAHEGRWLVRIEDVDTDRCDPSWVPVILEQLARCGLQPDAEPVWQSQRSHLYESALVQLSEQGQLYSCGCSRHDIRLACQHLSSYHATSEGGETPYPGTCRDIESSQGSNAACSLALKPDGVVASRRHSPSYDSSSRLASGLDGSAIKRHLSPDTTLAACRTWGVESENQPQRGQFLPGLQAHSSAMGQKDGEKWGAAADLQPTTPKSDRLLGLATGDGRAIRVRCGSSFQPLSLTWEDRRLGLQHQNLTQQVGDFVLKRRDGLWAYQLAVVVDDADQGITHVVRGEDLYSNTARQIHLQHLLSYPMLRYLHAPLVLDEQHRKLSKHTGAPAIAVNSTVAVMSALRNATEALQLGLPDEVWRRQSISDALAAAVKVWRQQWNPMA